MDWLPEAQVVTIPSAKIQKGNRPRRVVLATTEMRSATSSFGLYEKLKSAPHLTVEVDTGVRYQHLPFTAISEGTKKFINNPVADGHTIVVAIVGQAANSADLPIAWLENLGDLVGLLLTEFNIPAVAPEFFDTQVANILAPDAPQRFNLKQWDEFTGLCGMQHVPRSNRWDPGALDVATVLNFHVPSVGDIPEFTVPLKKNSRNSLVPVWQKALGVEQSGRFDAATIAATKNIQAALSLKETGFADEETWNAVAAIAEKRDVLGDYPSKDLSLGSHGPHVARWQSFLGIEPDGSFGPETKSQTIDFQKSIQVAATGSVDSSTWAKARFQSLQV
jgi:hypothetical protein